ncbi:hypothetical protein [Enterococcus sp. AZ102]|uniref:hypothetical protein n=1 Tax=Enterococcus sp. AZ102 TaxID=2774865 RepID=UPI003F688BD8
MKKIAYLFLSSTLVLGLVSPVVVKGEESTTSTTGTSDIGSTVSSINSGTSQTKSSPDTTSGSIYESSNTEETTIDTESTSETSKTVEPSLFATRANVINGIVGDGTQANPFQVNTFTEMKSVATTVSTSSYYTSTNTGSVYIKLMANITSTGSGADFSNNTNSIIIDGATTSTSGTDGKFSILYTGSTTTSGGIFSLGSSNMNISFNNINFGSTSSSISTYYGFCTSTSASNTMNIRNVSYYAQTGGQPFFVTGSNSVLNFYGNNSFVVSNTGSQNQEFAEFTGIMNFKTNSKTSIVQKTNEVLAFIWNYSSVQMNVESNAEVFIQSGKTEMFYPSRSAIISLAENAKFTYYFDPRLSYIDPSTVFGEQADYKIISQTGSTNASSNNFFDGKTTLNIVANKNSSLNFLTNSYPYQTGNLDISSVDTSKITFKNTDSSKSALNNGSYTPTLSFTNSTANNTIYNFQKTTLGSSPTISNDFILPSKSITKMTSGFENYNSLIFKPAVKIDGITSTGSSASSSSKVSSNLTGVSSALDNTFTYQSQYYVSSSTTILDDATVASKYTNASATPSNSSTHYDGSVYKALTTLPSISSTTGDQSTSTALDQLLPGTYRVYGRLQIKDSSGNFYYTPWQNTTATINPYSSFVFPSSVKLNDSFTYQRTGGTLGLKFDQTKLYTISSSSNQVMDVKPTAMVSNSSNQVTLVSGTPGTNNDKKLQLKLISSTTTPNWNLGDLTSPTVLELQPYWDTTNSKKQFYFDGVYSGPFITNSKALIDYNLIFSMAAK